MYFIFSIDTCLFVRTGKLKSSGQVVALRQSIRFVIWSEGFDASAGFVHVCTIGKSYDSTGYGNTAACLFSQEKKFCLHCEKNETL